MAKQTIFISSVQQEFSSERQELFTYLQEPTFHQQEYFKIIIYRPITVDVDPTSTSQVPHKYRRSTAGVP